MLSIGEFSRICVVTTKTLRYYDEIGLLKPKIVNEQNGYRYYDMSQLETMLLINKLKSYTFSLEEVQEALDDPQKMLRLLKIKSHIIKEKISEYGYIMRSMQKDMVNMEKGEDIMSYMDDIKVELVERPDVNILSSRQNMSIEDFGKYYGILFSTVLKHKYTIAGAPVAIYHDKEFDPENNDTETGLVVKEDGENIRVLEGGLHVKSVHKGPYYELPSVYAKMQKWVEENGYTIARTPFEAYLNDPCMVPPEEYITEVYFPICK